MKTLTGVKMLKKITYAALAAAVFTQPVHANEADVKRAVETRLGVQGAAVKKLPYAGLYEVVTEGQILYTDEGVNIFINGDLIDSKTAENLTQKKLFSVLPFDHAVKIVRGNGKRVIATFEDPNCGYCKRLAKDLQKMNDVTIYTFLYPVLSQDSLDKSRSIWCSTDRVKAWNDWMLNDVAPAAKGNCPTPIEKIMGLGAKMNIRGTPTILLPNGMRMPGAVPVAEIEKALAAVK